MKVHNAYSATVDSCEQKASVTNSFMVSGYKYIKSSQKCYKVNNKPHMWQEAMKTCFMEGGTLAVIENSAQALDIYKMIDGRFWYFVGVRRLFSQSDYYTVKGTCSNSLCGRGKTT